MDSARNEFTNITTLRAEALGQPGKRTFRILVDSGNMSAVVWLEKEQLFQLALAIHQLLVMLPEDPDAPAEPPGEPQTLPVVDLELKVSRLVLGHDDRMSMFIIDAHDEDDEEEEALVLRLWASRQQVKELSEDALRVCASGRPLCPLCGGPIDSTGHQCPRVNGHANVRDL